MTFHIPRYVLTGALAVVVLYGVLGAEVQCTSAGAGPPKLTILAADFDALAQEVDAIETAAASRFQLVGFTTALFLGTEGPPGYSRACHAELPGSRWCTGGEVFDSTNPPDFTEAAWVRAKLIGPGIYESGMELGGSSDLTCGRWTNGGGNGMVLTKEFSSTGTLLPRSCDVARPVACCAFVP